MVLRRNKAVRAATAYGYVRYSTDKQGENSVGRQCEAIERWSARVGVQLLGVFFDFATSRTTEHGERPGLVAALDTVKGQGISVLVAENVSRWAFDAVILGAIRTELVKRGARLATADETGNADLDEDRQDFEAMFSKREIKQIRQRTKGALAVKKLRGELTGSAPFGKRVGSDGVHLEANPDEVAIIARAKALSDAGGTVRGIAATLAAEGIVGRTGRALSHTQVHRILRPLLLAASAFLA